jgi:hypothetical protein
MIFERGRYARSALCTALLALAAATAGCSGATDGGTAQPTGVVTSAPDLSEIAGRKACIDAWAKAVLAHPRDWSPGLEETPEECPGQLGDNWATLYVLGKEKAEKERVKLPPIDDGVPTVVL